MTLKYTFLKLVLGVLFCFSNFQSFAFSIEYILSMPEPYTHYYEVEALVKEHNESYIDFKMAVWTPGSYLVREYAKNVEGFTAKDGSGNALKSEKISKNTWRVYNNQEATVKVNYKVYAYEMSVRTSFLDLAHGYLNPASVFMFVDKKLDQSAILTIKPYTGWEKVSTGLPNRNGEKFIFDVPNFDVFVDSPIEIGNHQIFEFKEEGVLHKVALYGLDNADKDRMIQDFKAIVKASVDIYGEHPCKNYLDGTYTFIIHLLKSGGGGLEHLNSTTVQYPREANLSGEGFLGLIAHEYSHLWNVKRLRPIELGPFDYENENYTHLLWFSEGFTSYYEEVILLKADLIKKEDFYDTQISRVTEIMNTPGNKVQSVAEASMDAWIKFYRPNENSSNSTISYYTKGAMIGMYLDIEICNATKGEKNLDDLMRYMYEEYYKKQNRGFTDAELIQALSQMTGKDFQPLFDQYIYSTETIDFVTLFGYCGFDCSAQQPLMSQAFAGFGLNNNGAINNVKRDSPAYRAGLNVNDKLLGVDGQTISDIPAYIAKKSIGDNLVLKIERDGKAYEIKIVLEGNPKTEYVINNATEKLNQPNAVLKKWLRK